MAGALEVVVRAANRALAKAPNFQPVAWRAPSTQWINGAYWPNYIEAASTGSLSPAQLWRTQPHLRTVVDFLARNVAQLGLHLYARTDDGGRVRVRDSLSARVLKYVDGDMTTFELIYALVGDFMLYDRGYLWLRRSSDGPGYNLVRLPPTWVQPSPEHSTVMRVGAYQVGIGQRVHLIPAVTESQTTGIIRLSGYSPDSAIVGSSKVEALKATLQEQIEAARYRTQVWKRGGRVSAVLQRPVDSPEWTDKQREAFREDWYAKFTGAGSGAGGTPILEDGMTLNRIDFTAREQQFVEASRLSLATVCGVYHVNPTMVGATEGASYSNVKEFSRMLYTDTLGPTLAQFAQRFDKHVLQALGDGEDVYSEFNIAEKLAGSFEEQAAQLQTAVGGPWMARNEARARMNLPAVDGGDELITPMNVTIGGQASPTDSGSQNTTPSARPRATSAPHSARQVKAPRAQREAATAQVEAVLDTFFARQRRVLKSRKDDGSAWDAERWDRELAAALLDVSMGVATASAVATLEANGLDAEGWTPALALAYVRESSERKAEAINAGTRERLAEVAESDPDADAVDTVLASEAKGRAHKWGAAIAAFTVGFAAVEAARQNGAESSAVKTWRTTSNDPRSAHKRLNGVSVPVGERFPNGLEWPGSFGDPDEVAGCKCEVDVEW